MKITYIAKRNRNGAFHCYDVVADGIYLNLFLSNGAPVEEIAQEAEEWLANPFPDQRRSDSITVVSGLLGDPESIPLPEEEPPWDADYPEGTPSMKWTAVEMQSYLGNFGIEYSDGDAKKVMLVGIRKHFS